MPDLLFGVSQFFELLISAVIGVWITAVTVAMPLTLGMVVVTVALPVGLFRLLNRRGRCLLTWPGWIPSGVQTVGVVLAWIVAQVWIWFIGPVLFFLGLIYLLGG